VTASERSERLYLFDIREAINRILTYTASGRDTFVTDAKTQDAVIRNIEIIGEATRNISETTRTSHPEVPWRDISDMRNKVIHDYFRVDQDIVWDVVQNDLPSLRAQIEAMLAEA
jgi:uncharacterized protein with HEPN domain